MGRYNFTGFVEDITERQLEYIGEVLEKTGIKAQDVTVEPVGIVGDNYVADVRRIIADNDGTPFKMIAKLASTDEAVRMGTNIELMFWNEHVMYTEILPKFQQIQLDANLEGDDLYRFPKCYGSLFEQPNEVILLEDLKESNFGNQSRYAPLSHECVKSVLKSFAIFHSLSFALKSREPETFAAFAAKLREMFSDPKFQSERSQYYFVHLQEMVINMVESEKHKKVVRGTVVETSRMAAAFVKAEKGSLHSVIRQGDGWSNNIMFRIEDGVPIENILIDYQLACELNLVYDLHYFLLTSTDHEQRHQHYYEYIDHYYNELDKALQHYGLKANLVYSRDHLDADLRRYAKFGLALSILVSSVIIRNPEEAAKMKEAMKTMANEDLPPEAMKDSIESSGAQTMVLFKKKVEDMIESFIEFGLV